MAVQGRDAGGDFGKEAKNALNQERKNREKPLQVEGVTGHKIVQKRENALYPFHLC